MSTAGRAHRHAATRSRPAGAPRLLRSVALGGLLAALPCGPPAVPWVPPPNGPAAMPASAWLPLMAERAPAAPVPNATVDTVRAGPAGAPTATDSLARVRVLLLSETGTRLEGSLEIRAADASPDASEPSPAVEPGFAGALMSLGEGLYASDALVPGSYRLRAAATGYADTVLALRLHTGEVRELVLRLSRRPVSLPEIVAAARAGTDARPLQGGVDAVSFRKRSLGATTLAEWLETLPGVRVRRTAAGRQLVSVRGSRPEGVLVLLDGVPLNDPVTGLADLTGVPTSTLESATLVRGTAVGSGPGSLAGVLVLRTLRPEGASASVALEGGSQGHLAADAHLSAAGELGRLAASLRLEAMENDFRFENRLLPGRPTETRRNADSRRAHASLTASPAGMPVLLRLRLDGLEQGAPGRMGTALFDRARWEEGGIQAAAEVGGAEWSGVGSFRRRALRYRDPRAARDEEHVVEEVHLRAVLPLRADWRLSGHLERAGVHGDGFAATAIRRASGASLSGTVGRGPIRLAPGLALDMAGAKSMWSPSLGLVIQPAPSWELWSRAGRALRLPALGDQYATSTPRVGANPSLRPERVDRDVEVGGSWTPDQGRAGARVASYHRRTVDPIVWLASSVGMWSPRNLDRLTAEGVEADVFWLPARGWRLEAAGSAERSRVGFGTNRNPLPYAPGLQARAAAERSWTGRALRVDIRSIGSRTTSLAATHRLPSLVLVDLLGRQELSLGGLPLMVDVRLRNALDARYELVSLVPEPGRRLELRLQLGPVGGSAKRPARRER